MRIYLEVLIIFNCFIASLQALSNQYLGCYKDSERRDLALKMTNSNAMSIEMCNQECQGYQYFGVQHGTQCFCGNSYGGQGKVADSECGMSCGGNQMQTCGGVWRNSVYAMTATLPSNQYFGCYKDSERRDLTMKMTSDVAMTIELCDQACQGYKFFGVQYATQCFCGNSYGGQGKVADSECNYKCGGNQMQICGGFWRNSIYAATAQPFGCYMDSEKRDLALKMTSSNTMRIEMCNQECQGYQYFGVQYGTQCFCGNSYGGQGKVADWECNYKCSGNQLQLCGGFWRNTIYAVTPISLSNQPLGCYKDSETRDLALKMTNSNAMSIEMCNQECQGYQNFGVQHGTQCFCGNSYGGQGKVADSECYMRCGGNQMQICGGVWRNSVYVVARSAK